MAFLEPQPGRQRTGAIIRTAAQRGDLACQETRQSEACQHADEDARRNQTQALPQNHCENIAVLRAERQANVDLVGAKRDGIGHYTKNTDQHERGAESGARAGCDHAKLRLRVRELNRSTVGNAADESTPQISRWWESQRCPHNCAAPR